jgi:hypothetical protein
LPGDKLPTANALDEYVHLSVLAAEIFTLVAAFIASKSVHIAALLVAVLFGLIKGNGRGPMNFKFYGLPVSVLAADRYSGTSRTIQDATVQKDTFLNQ